MERTKHRLMRLGIFGGSFNPVHMGHIHIALAAMKEAALSHMLLMVAADPPHKAIAGGVSAKTRLEMARLAQAEYPSLTACGLELFREGKSYTADTVAQLKTEYPGAEVSWLIGEDMLLTLDTWHDPARLMASTHFLVAGRPGNPGAEQAAQEFREKFGANITMLHVSGPEISSSSIRARVAAGLPIEGLTCGNVIQYIYEKGLYLPEDLRATVEHLKAELKPKRFAHTMGVARCAAVLAQRYGVDPAKARLAAFLHDCAKDNTAELARLYGLRVEDSPEPIRHAPVGAAHAKWAYGITDQEVLQAISLHTVCGSNMTALDKIIYLADKIEPGRSYAGMEEIRQAAARSLNEGMLSCIDHTAAHLTKTGQRMHPATIAAREEIQNQQKRG
ncbi:MAG: nicotinate (nicotinamide) nucleotide adenylyltransferase [Clostridia bacterium]|nr:nicotinate (nicotinamide) nucleotide adenylyltransferase [Clostridia bacterium]